MFKHLRRLLDLFRTLRLARPGAYPRVVFTEQHTPDQVTTYEVAREILGRHLGQALAAKRAATDPIERERLAAAVTSAVQRRKALRVGSPEAEQIVADAKATRTAALARG